MFATLSKKSPSSTIVHNRPPLRVDELPGETIDELAARIERDFEAHCSK